MNIFQAFQSLENFYVKFQGFPHFSWICTNPECWPVWCSPYQHKVHLNLLSIICHHERQPATSKYKIYQRLISSVLCTPTLALVNVSQSLTWDSNISQHIEAQSLKHLLCRKYAVVKKATTHCISTTCLSVPSVLWHCWLGHLTRKNPSPIWPIMCLAGH